MLSSAAAIDVDSESSALTPGLLKRLAVTRPLDAALERRQPLVPDGALCTRDFLYSRRNPARTSRFSD
jgi:hypothetical protein